MFLKLSLAAIAACTAILAPTPGEARTRLNLQFFAPYDYSPSPEYYYPGPLVSPRPRYHAFLFEGDDEDYDEPVYAYEPDYYEPEYIAPKPRKHQPKARLASRTAPKALAPAPVKRKPAPAAAKLISCSKATGIVTGYGFSDVTSTDCKGQSYAFKAKRDGKPYVIKLSATSGELTDVAKQ